MLRKVESASAQHVLVQQEPRSARASRLACYVHSVVHMLSSVMTSQYPYDVLQNNFCFFPAVQALNLQRVHLGSDPQLRRLARANEADAAPLSAMSGLQRLRLSVGEPILWETMLKQLAALARHARQLTSLLLSSPYLLHVGPQLIQLADSLRLLPELRELEVSYKTDSDARCCARLTRVWWQATSLMTVVLQPELW